MNSKSIWAGRIASGAIAALLLVDAIGKLLMLDPVVKGTTQLGYPETVVLAIGIIQLVCIVAYVVPSTSVLGAVLLTGYLGGAIATHVRIGSPLFTHVFFPLYVATFVWGGLFLRDERLRALLPFRGARGSAQRIVPVRSREAEGVAATQPNGVARARFSR